MDECKPLVVGWNGAGKTTQLRIITGEMEAGAYTHPLLSST